MSLNYKFHNPEDLFDDIIIFGQDRYETRDTIARERGQQYFEKFNLVNFTGDFLLREVVL